MRARFRHARSRSIAPFAAIALLGACKPDPEVSTVALSLERVQSCELGTPTALRVRTLGDFPAQEAMLDPKAPTLTLDELPLAARALVFDATYPKTKAGARERHAYAIAALGSGGQGTGDAGGASTVDTGAILLLPESRSCPLGDPLALAQPGAAVAALSRGGLLIAGGLQDTAASSNALRLPAGAELIEQVPDGMLVRRAFASATRAGPYVLVAGGVAGETGDAHDNYEVFDETLGTFARERNQKLRTGPRMEHAAVALRDGRVLLAGGRAQVDGEPLATAEWIDPASGERQQTEGMLNEARVSPALFALESGRAFVLGGFDAGGARILSIERWSATRGTFTLMPEQLPLQPELAFAASDSRIFVLGCDTSSLSPGCALYEYFDRGADLVREDVAMSFVAFTPNGLGDPHLLVLADGRLLVTGADPRAAISRRAFVIDLSDDATPIVAHDASRVPTELVALADGSVAELDEFGASLRREVARTVYESPSGDLVHDAPTFLAFDAPSHWTRVDAGLSAHGQDARLELPTLRFADVKLTWIAEGSVTLAVHDAGGAELVLDCAGEAHGKVTRVATRRGAELTLSNGAGKTLCKESLKKPGPIALSLRAKDGALLRELRVTRL